MKRSMIVATFLVAGAGAVAVGANPANAMKGSDTLFDLTTALFAACPGIAGSSIYSGMGSGNGQAAMVNGAQQTAPMSRFIDNRDASCLGALQADGGHASISQAEGLVVGLDGIAIVGSNTTASSTSCNGDVNAVCGANFEPGTGAAYNTTISTTAGSYTFTGWRDVLRVLLAGFDHTNLGTDAAAWAARDCNSAVRQAIANNWGDFFENDCAAPAGDILGNCTEIRHVFRMDDFSGTSDTLVSLLGLPAIVYPETSVTVNFGPPGGPQTIPQHTGASPFCNSVRPAFVFPAASNWGGSPPASPTPQCLQGPDFTWDPTELELGSCPLGGSSMPGLCMPNQNQACSPACVHNGALQRICQSGVCLGDATPNTCTSACGGNTPICVGGVCTGLFATTNCASACPSGQTCYGGFGGSGGTCSTGAPVCASGTCCRENAVYRATMQDNDPIRRKCNIHEQACSHSGNLGLVLPMNDVPEPNPSLPAGGNVDRYNPMPCVTQYVTGVPPEIFDAITQKRLVSLTGTRVLCPNGDTADTSADACLYPASPTIPPGNAFNRNAQCMPAVTQSSLPVSNVSVPFVDPHIPGPDGREYTQHLMAFRTLNATVYQLNGFSTPFPITGAFHRIHTTTTLASSGSSCQLPDMTDQIGCLVQASPCSVGYASRSTFVDNPTTAAVKVNLQSPTVLCIQGDPAASPPIAGFTYPLSRKLYLNSLPGFANVTGEELQLAGCETDLAQPGFATPTPAGLMTANASTDLDTFGFIHVAPSVNAGEPYCEDFNEQTICGLSVNSNACGGPHTNFTNFPTFNTTCGNGLIEPYEDCDPGTVPGPDSNCLGGAGICTSTCRCR